MSAQDTSSNDRYKVVFDTSSDAIMLLDERGFFDCNPATLRVFGYATKEDFCGKSPAEHSPPTQPNGNDSTALTKTWMTEAYQKGSVSFEWVHRKSNGEYFPAEVRLTAFSLNGKQILQATVRDISQRRKSDDLLKQKNEELEKMNKLMMGRELKMVELKNKIAELEAKLSNPA